MSDTGRASIAASNLPARKSGTVDISSHGSSLPTSRSLMLRAEFLASLEAHSSVASCLRYAGHRPLCRCAKPKKATGTDPLSSDGHAAIWLRDLSMYGISPGEAALLQRLLERMRGNLSHELEWV